MKRTAFVQKRPPARPAKQWTAECMPGPRSVPERVSDGLARAIVQVPKSAPVRSESYRRFVASFGCFGCGIAGYSQAAHPNIGKGLSIKTSDLLCFPLCAARPGMIGCHAQHDLSLDMDRSQRMTIEAGYIDRMRALAVKAGRPEFA